LALMFNIMRKYLTGLCRRLAGYTFIELMAVSAIVLIVAAMAIGSASRLKRFAIEEKAVTRLKQLADAQERYRYSLDPTVNPEGTYATFEELQLTNYISEDYVEDDVSAHTVNAFIPYYQIEIARSPNNLLDEPDANNYYIVLTPLGTKGKLKTFYMLEDGEAWHSYGLNYYER
jgi:prepilin-type N-terminal cleavage/methylation domain-containing protein